MQGKLVMSLILVMFIWMSLFTSRIYAQTFELDMIEDLRINVGYAIDIEGNYAFVADNDGVSIIDITDPTNVILTKLLNLPSAAFGIQVIDGIAFVACSTSGFYIINITDIYNPVVLSHNTLTGTAVRVFIQGNLAFISDYFNGLTIYDISSKSNPTEESFYYVSGSIWYTVSKDDIAYTANSELGIEVLNISDPTTPVRLSILPSTVSSTHLSIHENKLFVGRHGNGLKIFNISNPSSPTLMGSYYDSDGGEELGLDGNDTYLAVADNFGIELFDIESLPTITKLAEYRENVGAAHDVIMKDNFIYAVDGLTGFFVLEIKPQLTTTESKFFYCTFFSIAIVILLMKKRTGKHRTINKGGE